MMAWNHDNATALYQLWFDQQLTKWARTHEEIKHLTKNTYLTNKQQLRIVLTELKDTVVGQMHHLNDMLRLSDGNDDRLVTLFTSSVPVSTYKQIEDYVNQMINNKLEFDLLIPSDKVLLYAETTGTTSKSKRFAVHKQGMRIIQTQMND
ncbi:hypothetical protein I4U23_004117 [Adineta vaga]|nr:hypothetical protein I4U23_004117 [Adineta vaga]